MRIMLPAGSRTAKSRAPQNWLVGSWTTSTPDAVAILSKVASRSSARTCTPLRETVMTLTLLGHGDLLLLRNCSLARAVGPALARPGHHHRLARGHGEQVVVVASPVSGRRLADQ